MSFRVRFYDTDSLEDHALLIHKMVQKSLKDGETRKLALALAGGQVDWIEDPRRPEAGLVAAVKYHGRWYRAAPAGEAPVTCGMRDATCEVTAIWNFLVLNMAYRADVVGVDTYQDLQTSLESGGGDCDDFTIAFSALLQALGYMTWARIVSEDGEFWAHVYPIVLVGDQYVALDATEPGKRPGWEFSRPLAVRDFSMIEYPPRTAAGRRG